MDADQADTVRDHASALLSHQPGFITWTPFKGVEDPNERVDLVAWTDHHSARLAAKVVGNAAEFADFRGSVATVTSMGHYIDPSLDPQPVVAGSGIGLGRFRLKSGVKESSMRAAYAAMIVRHLKHQPGWRRQHLVKLQDGTFIDLAFARDQDHAEAICAVWIGNVDCEHSLSMIEPVSMEFGTII
ncbi:hypothetical protein [Sphingomonas sp. T9W2]|uniref:hypothetical protein n=1 Tax=Sphingomonas sp. T9W2 TaxID=3143183 RepID=UPI0031F4A23C